MRRRSAAALAIAMIPVVAAAQQFLPNLPETPADPNVAFEVAVIKPLDAGARMTMRMTPGRFESTGVPVGMLLRQALQKPDYQIAGAPGWIESERYSITAKVPEGVQPTAMSVLLLNLLKDRLQLATHLETREQPIFNLVLARPDGRLGADLKATPAECQAIIAERIAAAKAAVGRGGPPRLPPLPGPNEPLPCGFGRVNAGAMSFSGRTLAEIIPILSDLARRPVIDKTELTGMYDFTLKFSPESAASAIPLGLPQGTQPPAIDPDAPSFYAAVQEQLGLKLENARGPVEVVVIDKIEKPTLD